MLFDERETPRDHKLVNHSTYKEQQKHTTKQQEQTHVLRNNVADVPLHYNVYSLCLIRGWSNVCLSLACVWDGVDFVL